MNKEQLSFTDNINNNISNEINNLRKEYKSNINNLLNNGLIINKECENIHNLNLIKQKDDIQMSISNYIKPNYFEIIDVNKMDNKFYETEFYKFFYSLKSQSNIDKNLLKEINNYLEKNKFNFKIYKLFLNSLNQSISKKTYLENISNSSLFILKSFTNLVSLTNIMNNIIESIKDYLIIKTNRDALSIFEEIVKIGEKSVFNNIFMCSLLSKNKIFQNILIWKNSIFISIISLLFKTTKEYDENNKIELKNDNHKNYLELIGLHKHLIDYNKFSEKKKIYINSKLSNEIIYNTIKIYLSHFGNYNFILENPLDINEIIFSDLHIDNQEMINYFIKSYSVFIHSIKNDNYDRKIKILKEKISLIKTNKNEIIEKKYSCNIESNKSKYIILKYSSKFLPTKDNLNLMHLNKDLSIMYREIYKNLLSPKNDKQISLEKRLNIWRSCLKYKTYSSVFDYNQLLLEINKKETIERNKNLMEQMMKDLKRTKCKDKESLGAIFNILRCLAYSNDNVNYYQGLNFICLFLYELTKNEEETFTLINNLICFTAFGDILENNFKKLDIYCNILEKLIYLFLPRIYSLFNDNQIKLIYFINPYLFTLFTNVYASLPENNLKFMFYVWDNFLLNWWKSVFEILLAIFKSLENKLLSLNGDEILAFLGNDLWKNEIFYDENFEAFLETKKKFKLDNELIDLIMEEQNIEKSINKTNI